MGEEHKKLDKLYDLLCEQVEEVTKKGTLSATEMDSVYKAVQTMLNIVTLKAMNDSGYSNGVEPYRHTYGRPHMSGKYSYGIYPGYSGHSINDRMIAAIEDLYDSATSEHDRNRIGEIVNRIRTGMM